MNEQTQPTNGTVAGYTAGIEDFSTQTMRVSRQCLPPIGPRGRRNIFGPGAMSIMRRLSAIVLCVSAATWIYGTASAAGPKAKPKAQPKVSKSLPETIAEEQAAMIRQCKLNDDQQKAVKEKFDLKRKALETWEQANGEKLAAAKAAQRGADAAAKQKAGGEVRALTQARTQVEAEADKAITALLSPEQQLTWAGYQLAQLTLSRYQKAKLTEEQTAKIQQCSLIAAKELASFTEDDRKGKQGRTTVQKCLKWAIDNVILTPEQREAVAAKKPAGK